MDSGRVSIIHYRHIVGEPLHQANLLDCERCATGGHCIGDSYLVHGEHIEISLYQIDLILL